MTYKPIFNTLNSQSDSNELKQKNFNGF